ncbi:substrate-binding domain-containing protein [Lichenihabitans sp. Uapishka_5]|uniref:substrate-binding domain-containing protein n=1 Tax=Lichenihabitans sp. Uapishka_5 TaxID=3037302 RepID=UPI0029E81706|nr:substrate-binding domain-containing protein [Lichenihabitans sp. Uapishka_5]MDX7951309.1 substrate-binding domain-containing protein [Lichenihabitans sp. Uapishka_5]
MTHALLKLATATILAAGLTTAAEAKDKTFALVQYNQQVSFFTDITRGAQEAAKAAGDKLLVFDANNSAQAQDSAFETYIQQKVDGIVIVSVDQNGIMPAVRSAAAAKIPVVAVDGVLPDGPQASQISVDNYQAGKLIGQFYIDYIKKNMGGKATLGDIGALNSDLQNLRQKGFDEVVKAAGGVTTVGVVDGRNIQDQALAAGENLLTGNPDLQTLYATGEPALVGAIAAAQSQGRTDKLKIFGWDLSAQAVAAIDAGFVVGVVQQDPFLEGKKAVEALATLAGGGTVEKSIKVPVTIVTKANVGDFRAAFK